MLSHPGALLGRPAGPPAPTGAGRAACGPADL